MCSSDLTLDGREEVRLSTLRGRVVVVSFERRSCGGCLSSELALDEAWRQFREMGVAVMGIRRNAPPVATNVGSTPGPWPVLADPHGVTAAAYGVRDSMETFVIDGDGKVVAALDGPVKEAALSAQLAAVLGVPDPAVPSAATEASTTAPEPTASQSQEPATTAASEPPATTGGGAPSTS